MRGAIPPPPQYAFMTWCVKHRENFTFTFIGLSLLPIYTAVAKTSFSDTSYTSLISIDS
jgi:hypothetical protein